MELIPRFLKDYYLCNNIKISDKLEASIICNSKALDFKEKIFKLVELTKRDIHPIIKKQIENSIEDVNISYRTFFCKNGNDYRYVIADKQDKPLLVCESFPIVENILNTEEDEYNKEYYDVYVKLYKTENRKDMYNDNDLKNIQFFDKNVSYIEVKNFTNYIYIKNELSDYIDWRIEQENLYKKEFVDTPCPATFKNIQIPYKVGGVVKNIYDHTFGVVRQINPDEYICFNDLWLDVEFYPYQQNINHKSIFSYKERVNVFDLDASEFEFKLLDEDYQYKILMS